MSSGEPYETEFRLRRLDGACRWHVARAVPIRGAAGEIERWIGSNTDIELQKSATEELTQLAANLEREIAKHTDELVQSNAALKSEIAHRQVAEGRIHHLQKMESLGQLTGGIAHDFNNMLGVVIGSLNLMERRIKRGDSNVQQFIAGALEGANRAASLTPNACWPSHASSPWRRVWSRPTSWWRRCRTCCAGH